MNDFLKRVERIKAALAGRQPSKVTLVFEDGTRKEGDFMELLSTVSERGDIVDVISEDETTRSLLLAMRGPWDFSDLEELKGEWDG